MGIYPNIAGMIPTKIVQTVTVGCISGSRGHNIRCQNAIFKNLTKIVKIMPLCTKGASLGGLSVLHRAKCI